MTSNELADLIAKLTRHRPDYRWQNILTIELIEAAADAFEAEVTSGPRCLRCDRPGDDCDYCGNTGYDGWDRQAFIAKATGEPNAT